MPDEHGQREQPLNHSRVGSTNSDAETTTQEFKSGIRGREPLKLILRFLVVLATAPAIAWMMGRVWVSGRAIHDRLRMLLGEVTGMGQSDAIRLGAIFLLSVYFGLLVLLIFDIKKRVQAMLLLGGTVIGMGVIGAMGVLFPFVNLEESKYLFGIVIGFLLGVSVGLPELLRADIGNSSFGRPTRRDGSLLEFRNATRIVIIILIITVVATLVGAFEANVWHPIDPIASVVLLVVGTQFLKYESEGSYMLLGPGRSGKSMMMLGLCLELMRNSSTTPNPNEYLMNGLERASNLKPGDEHWPIPSTAHDELQTASFEVIAGHYFPRRLELTSLDYAGQHLGRVADLFDRGVHENGENGIPHRIAQWIVDADTVLVVLDVERLVFPEKFRDDAVSGEDDISWGLEYYGTILDESDHDDALVVATKCDILIDQGRVPPPDEFRSYDEFVQQVTQTLASRPDVDQLLRQVNEDTIYPVYFATLKRDGKYVPYLDDGGNLVPVGYDHLIAELSTRQ